MANKPYENFVLERKLEDLFTTHVDLNQFVTVDTSLTEAPGMKKIINTYTATGDVEDVAMGEGNSGAIEVSFTPTEYEVTTTQGKFAYYDEQEMKDPYIVDVGVSAVATKMANDFTAKAIAEWGKGQLWHIFTNPDFEAFADAISLLNVEEEGGLFAFINPKMKAAVRKKLQDDLQYIGGITRTGYVGSISNVPIYTSKAVPDNTIYLATKAAVKVFIKKGAEAEFKRDPNLRSNEYFLRKVCLVALADATKVVRMTTLPGALLTSVPQTYTTASATAGSTVLHVGATPPGYKWVYKVGSSAVTFDYLNTAYSSGYTAITTVNTTIAMSANTHLSVALVDATSSKAIAGMNFTGDTLKIG